MALREFVDERGREWRVWDVYPSLAERRHRTAGPPPGLRERRRYVETRVRVAPAMSRGWLTFESSDGERRRLTPIPDVPQGWDSANEHDLLEWCAAAQPAPPARRLIE
jgi:hypothetical protein